MASAWTGVPMVHHLHSPTAADTTHRWSNRVNVVTERCSLLGIRGLIAVSHSLGAYAHQKGYAPELVTVVPERRADARSLLQRTPPTGTWTVGTVALVRLRKGLEVLLDVLAELHAAGADIRLRAVGTFETPEYEAAIKAQAERLGIAGLIDWRSFQRDVNAELAAMDLFVLPSLFGEGLPMVILELRPGAYRSSARASRELPRRCATASMG